MRRIEEGLCSTRKVNASEKEWGGRGGVEGEYQHCLLSHLANGYQECTAPPSGLSFLVLRLLFSDWVLDYEAILKENKQ